MAFYKSSRRIVKVLFLFLFYFMFRKGSTEIDAQQAFWLLELPPEVQMLKEARDV